MSDTRSLLPVLLAFSCLTSTAWAIEPGEVAKAFRLTDDTGREFVVSNFDERPATAIVFLSSRCPVTERSIGAINALYQKYRRRNVLYVGVCANSVETPDELRSFAQKRGMIFSIHRDPDGEVAQQLGATATPEVFLLDREARLVYRGGLDREAGLTALEMAIQQVLKNEPVHVTAVPAKGTPLDQPGEPIERTDLFGAPSFSSELVFTRIPDAPAHHCSTITQAPNGDLLCVWYGGSYESAPDQKLFLSRRTSDTCEWSTPEVLMEDRHMPPGNAVIFVDGHDRVQIIWGRMESTQPIRRGGGWDRCRLFARTSTDSGHTWSTDRLILPDDQVVQQDDFYFVPRNPPITLADGSMVLGLEGPGGGDFIRSTNGGDTWTRIGSASDGSQPTLIQREDGSLLTLMRYSPRTTFATSQDGGLSWSATQKTELNNPDSGISMVQLANGHLVFVFNNSPDSRTPLSVVRSTDEGRTWEQPLNLETNPGEYSYPCIIQSADGQIHVSYTFRRYAIKHVEFNEDWLTQFERPN